jgi:hypothetical protein
MTKLQEGTTDCIYGITSDYDVAKVWVKRCGSSVTLEYLERGTKIVETHTQDKLVAHASQVYNLTKAFKVPAMFFDSEETTRRIADLKGKAASLKSAAQKKKE